MGSILTGGANPIRTSSWTCCAKEPCDLADVKGDVGSKVVCNGFDVGGSGALTIGSLPCPHKPAACKESEEDELLGVCYTSCAQLTGGEFPHRLSPMTCCKV